MEKPKLHSHAVSRAQERFGLDNATTLLEALDSGRFVWLKGAGNSGAARGVRSGHLIFLPEKNEHCVVVMDDRRRLAITVLTEEMARKSSWTDGLNEASKLKAKQIALGKEVVHDSNFLRLYAEERGGISLKLIARAFTHDWKVISVSICKFEIAAEQIDPSLKTCLLTQSQEEEAAACIAIKIKAQVVRPYCDFSAHSGHRSVPIASQIAGTLSLEDGETARRLSKYSTGQFIDPAT